MIKVLINLSLVFFGSLIFTNLNTKNEDHEITICTNAYSVNNTLNQSSGTQAISKPIKMDINPALSYSMPMFSTLEENKTLLTWTEKDDKGETAFCMAITDNSKLDFSDKKVIYKGSGVGNSRMMRAKVLVKKDGTLVAVFSNREELPASEPGKRPKRALNIVYCESNDKGNTWTTPKPVDTDPSKVVRGFFDAIVLPNNEIAVVYLKDVENSTKHEERNLRLALTKNGVFQPERIIDPVVCDCCPINLFLDNNSHLNIVYRDNNDDIRDMAKLISKDNALSFSKPSIVYADNWKISGCPHQGALSTKNKNEGYLVWFTGAESGQGYRLTSYNGKQLDFINDATAKDPWLTSSNNKSVLLWQQNKNSDQPSMVVFKSLSNGNISEKTWIENTEKTVSVSAQIIVNQLIVAREVLGENKKNSLSISNIKL